MSLPGATPVIVSILSGEIMELKKRITAISEAHERAKADGKWEAHLAQPIAAASKLLTDDKDDLLV